VGAPDQCTCGPDAPPLPAESIDLAASSHALHHVDDDGKRASLRRADRPVIALKALQVLEKGPSGVVRLMRHATRVAWGTWEHPPRPVLMS